VCGLKHYITINIILRHHVTLRASVWIETWSKHHCLPIPWRHTPRECVDWNRAIQAGIANVYASHSARVCGLKPTPSSMFAPTICSHTPRECVDWNPGISLNCTTRLCVTLRASVWIETVLSLSTSTPLRSHSARVCGLKPFFKPKEDWRRARHTPRECVDWNVYNEYYRDQDLVTLRASVWIET